MYHNAYRAFLQRIYYNGIVISIPTFEDFLFDLDVVYYSIGYRDTCRYSVARLEPLHHLIFLSTCVR